MALILTDNSFKSCIIQKQLEFNGFAGKIINSIEDAKDLLKGESGNV